MASASWTGRMCTQHGRQNFEARWHPLRFNLSFHPLMRWILTAVSTVDVSALTWKKGVGRGVMSKSGVPWGGVSQKGCQWVSVRAHRGGVKKGVSRARGDWKVGGACEEPTLGSRARWRWFVTLTLAFAFAHTQEKIRQPNIRSCLLLVLLFYMAMAMGSLKRGGVSIFCLSLWFVSSHLSVTAPWDRKKEEHVNTDVWVLNCCAPFLLTSSLARIKGGGAHPTESDMYVCDLCNQSFSTQGGLKRHWESVHHQLVGFSCQVCGQHFYGKDHLGRHRKVHRVAVEVRRDLLGISAATAALSYSSFPEPRQEVRVQPLCQELRYT